MIRVGDCVDLMAGLEPCSVDAVVCDPPYELGFMGKAWDQSGVTYQPATWAEALRVLKPGGHLLAFGGTRTYHRLACAIEDAGFAIRDTICWLYGSGFPKSLDLSKAIDKQAGAEREIVGQRTDGRYAYEFSEAASRSGGIMGAPVEQASRGVVTSPATSESERWHGWGTALKPAHEPVVVARKPLVGTVAGNVLEYGVGALNVDGCRVTTVDKLGRPEAKDSHAVWAVENGGQATHHQLGMTKPASETHPAGRWPANVALDEMAAGMLDEQSGEQPSRFFYVAKASRAERNAGLEGFEEQSVHPPSGDGRVWDIPGSKSTHRRNHHPTVKPVALMRWLVRLVTPPDGLVLDPFAGSGTTGIAAILEGFRFLGMERDPEYAALAEARIHWWAEHGEDALRIVAERERADLERQAVAASGQLDLLG